MLKGPGVCITSAEVADAPVLSGRVKALSSAEGALRRLRSLRTSTFEGQSVKYSFKYYLHENAERFECVDDLVERAHLPREIAEKIAEQRPFYEIEFDCTYDDITGDVEYIAR